MASAIPPVPPTQAKKEPEDGGWKVPPLDGSLNLLQLLEFNYLYNSSKPLFVCANSDGSMQYISWHRAVNATYRVAAALSHIRSSQSVIAIFSSMDTITYWAYIHGVLASGNRPFPIAPGDSAQILPQLLKASGASSIIIDAEGPFHDVANSALDILKRELHPIIDVLTAQSFDQLFDDQYPTPVVESSSLAADLDSLAMILHSSGSSSHRPKLIPLTHRILVLNTRVPWYGDIDICGKTIGAASLFMFHTMGIIVASYAVSTGAVLAVFRPSRPPTLPTPHTIIDCYVKTSSNIAVCWPGYIEKWAENQDHVNALKNMFSVVFAGLPLPKPIGDSLVKQGVRIVCGYGTTELGTLDASFSHPLANDDWEYFRLSEMIKTFLEPQDDGTGMVELYCLPHELHVPPILNAKMHDQDCFATNDLLQPHPSIAGLWKFCGRASSQIVLASGKKTYPEPIEAIICESPIVRTAVMFGHGRHQNGILVDLETDHAFDPCEVNQLSEFLTSIWPFVEKANTSAPAHSRLTKDLIIVASPFKPFTYTAKGTPRRAIVLDKYSEEIALAYKELEVPTDQPSV